MLKRCAYGRIPLRTTGCDGDFKGGAQKNVLEASKLIIWNNALINALTGDSLRASRSNGGDRLKMPLAHIY